MAGGDEKAPSDLKARLPAAEGEHSGLEHEDNGASRGQCRTTTSAAPTSYVDGGEKRPLIEQVSNQWAADKPDICSDEACHVHRDDREFGFCDLDHSSSCPNTARDLFSSRRFRRMIALVLLSAVAFYYLWSRLLQPRWAEEWAYKEGFVSQANGTYGMARGGDKDMIRIKTLDPSLLPGGEADPEGKRRLVFVGDVHGCKKELEKLLKKVDFREETDHLVLVGDIISKGPDNVGVLDELIRLNATSVRGNHEDRVLHVAKKLHAKASAPVEATSSKGFAKDAAIVKQLKSHHLQFLRDMPLMLHVPTLPMAFGATKKASSPITEHMLIVHAGLVPGVRLEKQDPYFVMNMRSINRRTHVPSALRSPNKNAKPWYDVWSWYNDRIFNRLSMEGFSTQEDEGMAESEQEAGFMGFWKNFFGKKKAHLRPQVVIYGHDSKSGLQIHRWTKGIDSGCVGGGELTALVVDAKGRQELTSVKCKNYRS